MKEGWIIKDFDACVEKVKIPSKIPSSSYQTNGSYPIVSQEQELISGYWDDAKDLFVHQIPATVFGDHTMVVKYIDFDFVVGADGVKVLVPTQNIHPKFFFYWVSSIKIESRGYARHFRYLRENRVPLPSPSEQQRIVDILDKEFAKIDELKSNAEQNLQNAKNLFQAALKEVFAVQERCPSMTIEQTCSFQNGFAFKSTTFSTSGEPILRISDIQNDVVVDNGVVYFNPKFYKEDLSRFKVYPDDILIAMSGGTTGKIGINRTGKTFYLNQRVGVFREKKDVLNHMYLFYYLHTKSDESLKIAAGAAQPNLSTQQIKGFVLPVPSLPEQQTIVKMLDDLNAKCKVLQNNYTKTIALCDVLKQALLRKAFNGELL